LEQYKANLAYLAGNARMLASEMVTVRLCDKPKANGQ